MDNWFLPRDIDIFPPPHHTMIVCERDMNFEVIEGHKERRNKFVIDCFTGRSWGRIGTGRYIKYTIIPPVEKMLKPSIIPPPGRLIVICNTVPKFFGVRIGRFNPDGRWEIFGEFLTNWIAIPSPYVEGWLMLP